MPHADVVASARKRWQEKSGGAKNFSNRRVWRNATTGLWGSRVRLGHIPSREREDDNSQKTQVSHRQAYLGHPASEGTNGHPHGGDIVSAIESSTFAALLS